MHRFTFIDNITISFYVNILQALCCWISHHWWLGMSIPCPTEKRLALYGSLLGANDNKIFLQCIPRKTARQRRMKPTTRLATRCGSNDPYTTHDKVQRGSGQPGAPQLPSPPTVVRYPDHQPACQDPAFPQVNLEIRIPCRRCWCISWALGQINIQPCKISFCEFRKRLVTSRSRSL